MILLRREIKDLEKEKPKLDFNVSTAARIVSIRNMGKALFVNIQGEYERLQCYISNKNIGEDDDRYKILINNLDIGDIIGLKGEMFYTSSHHRY